MTVGRCFEFGTASEVSRVMLLLVLLSVWDISPVRGQDAQNRGKNFKGQTSLNLQDYLLYVLNVLMQKCHYKKELKC